MMNPKTEQLAVQQETTLAAPSVGQMLQAAIDKGVTNENVAVLERLMDLYERVEDKKAEKAFATAFNTLQSEMPIVNATKAVPDKNGNVKFRFAPYEEIMATVRPLLLKHGFTVTFSQDFKEGRIIQSCTLMHLSGHSRTNSFAARIGNGPPGASETQADGAASTYAKRFALCNALNILSEFDTDAMKGDVRAEGELIGEDKIQYLKEQVAETGSNEARFLNLAGVSKYEEIRVGSYNVLVRALAAKARAK